MNIKSRKDQIGLLAKLLEEANRASRTDAVFGKCEWTDLDGNRRCNSPWSQFQCEQAGGVFTPNGQCEQDTSSGDE